MVRREISTPTTVQKILNVAAAPLRAWQNRRESRAESILAVTSPYNISSRPRSERREVASALRFLGKRNPSAIKNWYEGGFPFLDGSRAWTPSIIQDARYDQNLVTRRELLRRMRYWAQNSGICKSTQDVRRQYVIGTHCPVVTSLSKNSDWAEMAEKVFEEMNEVSGVDGESFFSQLSVGCDVEATDGDVLFVETNVRAPITIRQGTKYETQIIKSVPRYQLIEGHRIETPPRLWDKEGQDIIDGVQFKIVSQTLPNGEVRNVMQRVGYWVKDSTSMFSGGTFARDDAYALIPVENCVLVFSPHRVNQIRGLSRYYAGETTLAMLEDLLKLELRAQEVQSDITTFVTNGAGQMVSDKMQSSLGALGMKLSKDSDGKPVVTAKDIEAVKKIYQEISGGRQVVGRTGDTLAFMAPNRPAEATQQLWEYLINIWCAAAKAPRILVFPKSAKGQGTEVRAELDKANTGFIGDFNLNWKPVVKSAWKFKIGWAIQNDARLANPPDDWQHIEVSPPRSVMVDLGYDSASQLAELAAGVTNLHFVAQRLGTTAKRLIAMAVQDIYQLKKACNVISGRPNDKIEVKPEEVRQSLGEVVKNLAAMKTAQAQTTAAEAVNA
jgi:hypothetical protein